MGAPAYQVTNLETCSPRQVALLVLGFFGLWATLYGLGASAPPLYVSQCSSSTRCADGVDGANLFSTGATPLYVSDPALCANKSACTRETCYLDRDGTLDWELQVAGLTSLNSFVLLEAFVTSRAAAPVAQPLALTVTLEGHGAALLDAEAAPDDAYPMKVGGRGVKVGRQLLEGGLAFRRPQAQNPAALAQNPASAAAAPQSRSFVLRDAPREARLECAAAVAGGGGGACAPLFLVSQPSVRWSAYVARVSFAPPDDAVGDVKVCLTSARPDAVALLSGVRLSIFALCLLALVVTLCALANVPTELRALQQRWAVLLLLVAAAANQPLRDSVAASATAPLAARVAACVPLALLPVLVLLCAAETIDAAAAAAPSALALSGRGVAVALVNGADPETSSSVARAIRLLAAALLVGGTTVALAEQRESLGAAPTRASPWSALPPAAMYAMYASLALVVAMLVVKAVGNASRLCASSRAAVAAALGVAAAAAAAASLAFGSAGLLPPTLPGALAAVGGCELYALLHAYVYLPVSWVGRDDGHDDEDDEL